MPGKDPDDTQELPFLPSPASEGIGPSEIRPEPALIGARVGSYVVRERIASGGGGTVYRAEAASASASASAQVAIKVLLRELATSAQALSRFQREAEVLSLIDHPNIVRVLDAGELPDGRPYIVMELAATENLKAMLASRGRLAPVEALEILEPICSALAAAHAAGVIHRDLKASNISVGNGDGQPVIRLLDFGIAKLVQTDPAVPGLTARGARLGTPVAMAPEQILGEPVDERVDIYALGVLTYQMLTGGYPFEAASPQEIERLHLDALPPPPSRTAPVSPALDAVVLRCLEKHREARFASVAEFLDAFRAAITGEMTGELAGASESEQPAVAIEVEVPDRPDQEDQEDQAAAVLDLAEVALREAGFDLPLQTGNLVLGVRLVPGEAAGNREARQQALDLARALFRRLDVKVCLHAGLATTRGQQVVGGPLLRVAAWVLVAEIRRRPGDGRSGGGSGLKV